MFKWGFLILILGFLTSCRKLSGDNTTVKGKVINDITQQPVVGFQIDIYENKATGFESQTSKVIESLFTDNNGEFETKFYASWKGKYEYDVELVYVNQMYDKSYTRLFLESDNISKKEDNYFEIKIAPAGNLTVQLSPPPPYTPPDSIQVEFNHKKWYLPHKIILTDKNTSNNNGSHTFYDLLMGEWTLNITKYKTGVTTNDIDTIYLNWNEEKTYTINF